MAARWCNCMISDIQILWSKHLGKLPVRETKTNGRAWPAYSPAPARSPVMPKHFHWWNWLDSLMSVLILQAFESFRTSRGGVILTGTSRRSILKRNIKAAGVGLSVSSSPYALRLLTLPASCLQVQQTLLGRSSRFYQNLTCSEFFDRDNQILRFVFF